MITTQTDHRAVRIAGRACASGAMLGVLVAAATQAVQASTDVPKDQWSYPWWSGASLAFWLVAALAQALIAVGVVGLRHSGVAGTTRAARFGLTAALAGAVLIVVGHLVSIPIRNQTTHDRWPQIVGGIFGIGTVLVAIGFLLAGRATLRAGVWCDWRRFTPLAVGACSAVLVGLQFTPALPSAVAVYGLCFVAVGIALATGQRRALPMTRAGVQQA
jgi:hypothetical protein